MTDRPQSLQLGGLVGGKYRLLKKIGEGGHGRVYRAINTLLGREVAIKVLKPELVGDEIAKKRFFREAKTANLVRHPNVVDVLDVGDSEQGPWMVQELLVGEALSAVLAREGTLSIHRTIDLLLPVLSALAVAHSKGIAHRDFKPENVFLVRGEDGAVTPKILDFGLSKSSIRFGTPRESDRITGTGVVVGTPAYLSPERVRMESDGDVRGDVWAIGVVLYECTTGFLPFPARTVREMFIQISNGRATPIEDVFPEVDANFAKIVMRCLRREPDQRYPSAAEIEEDIRRYLDGQSPEATQRHAALRLSQEPSDNGDVPPATAGAEKLLVETAASVPPPVDPADERAPSTSPAAASTDATAVDAVSTARVTTGTHASEASRSASADAEQDDEPSSTTRLLMVLLALVVVAFVVALWRSSSRTPTLAPQPTRDRANTLAIEQPDVQIAAPEAAANAAVPTSDDASAANTDDVLEPVTAAVRRPSSNPSGNTAPRQPRDAGATNATSSVQLRDNR
ncbi:MAG: protein kinase [Myxococcales bacterium]|nr:protein kinase [Myxococcales bacterium]